MYEMKDEYLTGIESVDTEHRRLFELAEETYQLQNNEFIPDKYDPIKSVLEELKDYTIMHFSHEEEYMQSIGYKKLFSQKIQHEKFIEWLSNQAEEFEEEDDPDTQDETISKILSFLTDWLINHIVNMDKQIGQD